MALFNYALVEESSGAPLAACVMLRESLALRPNETVAREIEKVKCGAPVDAIPSTKEAARALFDEGRKLASRGKHPEACVKYEESNRLDPAAGMLWFLADCNESAHKTTTAWKQFLALASMLRDTKQATREKLARARVESLARRLSGVTVQVPSASRIPGLVIKCDGRQVAPVQWGLELPLDPGKHILEASAPGMRTLTREMMVEDIWPGKVVVVPILAPEGTQPSLPRSP